MNRSRTFLTVERAFQRDRYLEYNDDGTFSFHGDRILQANLSLSTKMKKEI